MTHYACGHDSDIILLDNNALSLSAWMEWRDSVGFNGDKSMCWDCWCKKQKEAQK